MFPRVVRYLIPFAGSVLIPALAQVPAELADQELQRQQQRERASSEKADKAPDVRLPRPTSKQTSQYPNEIPCFPIQRIQMRGDAAAAYTWSLHSARAAIGRCLGSAGVNVVMSQVQNELLTAGYVTTRVVAPPQDLRNGELTLVVLPGRIREVRLAAATRRVSVWNALPVGPGDVLNLRDVEQALENFKRVPTADADIQILPGDQAGESDLLINWRQDRLFRMSVSADDSGGAPTGKYQGGVTLSVDNPLGWQDLFYVTLNHHLYGGGGQGAHGTKGWSLHYSIPLGYWLIALQANDYRYHQTVAGATQDYIYSGTSSNSDLKLSRLVYRDGVRKASVALHGWQRRSRNFIEDTEVEVQRRRMGGFSVDVNYKEFVGSATLDATVSYKRGGYMFGSMPAPEEAFGEGTARPVLINSDVSICVPMGSRLEYQLLWRQQSNRTPLVPQDRFAIGGRFTVRGFDGESALAAERGWLVRNDLSWSLAGAQQIYLALDAGQVAGPSTSRLLGSRLAGGGMGWRGNFKGLQYDFFTGKPIRRPSGFRTAAITHGFNLNYSY